jgi:type I restriction-modification system DNA methylase subunit
VLAEKAKREKTKLNPEPFLLKASGQKFYHTSPLDLKKLMGDQMNIGENLRAYMQGFTPVVRDIFEQFDFHIQIDRLQKGELLYLVTEKFVNIDLHPKVVPNVQMGAVFEELIRRFAELSNETAGEHFTPREVIALMVNLTTVPTTPATLSVPSRGRTRLGSTRTRDAICQRRTACSSRSPVMYRPKPTWKCQYVRVAPMTSNWNARIDRSTSVSPGG